MGAITSHITSLTIVYPTVYPGAYQRKHESSASLAFVRGEFPAQMASNAENVSIWWRHHGLKMVVVVIATLHATWCDNRETTRHECHKLHYRLSSNISFPNYWRFSLDHPINSGFNIAVCMQLYRANIHISYMSSIAGVRRTTVIAGMIMWVHL